MTAVFLFNRVKRLRFQNLGKPRTAGLCGRAVGACDCGPLSCAKIERPSPLEKPPCKVRLFAQNRFRKYRQKVTATTLFQTAFHPTFQLLPQTAHVRFHRRKRVHHSPFEERSHTAAHTPKQGAFRMGVVSLLSERSARSRTSPGRVSERRTLPLLGLGRVCFRRTQKAFGTAMRLCASLFRGVAAPLGCVICLQLGDVAVFFTLCAVLSERAKWGWYHYPRSVSHGSETLRGQGVERQTLPLLDLGRRRS